jgi:hypothetical protein
MSAFVGIYLIQPAIHVYIPILSQINSVHVLRNNFFDVRLEHLCLDPASGLVPSDPPPPAAHQTPVCTTLLPPHVPHTQPIPNSSVLSLE